MGDFGKQFRFVVRLFLMLGASPKRIRVKNGASFALELVAAVERASRSQKAERDSSESGGNARTEGGVPDGEAEGNVEGQRANPHTLTDPDRRQSEYRQQQPADLEVG